MGRFYRMRLLVGEGDFNFSVALIKKHPEVINVVTVTEYQDGECLSKRPKFCQL